VFTVVNTRAANTSCSYVSVAVVAVSTALCRLPVRKRSTQRAPSSFRESRKLLGRRRIRRGTVVYEHESISLLSYCGTKDLARMSQRTVDTSLRDFNGRDMPAACVQQNGTQDLLVEKLHIGTGSTCPSWPLLQCRQQQMQQQETRQS